MPMMAYVVVLLLAVGGALQLVRWTSRQPAHDPLRYIPWGVYAVLVLIVAVLAIGGGNHWLMVLVAAFAPLLPRIWTIARNTFLLRWLDGWFRTDDLRTQPWGGHGSRMDTPHLHMTLEHDTGAMDADIATGIFKGRRLSDLTLDQAQELYQSLRDTAPDSVAMVDAYLAKLFGDEWRERRGTVPPLPDSTDMPQEEALRVLGLDETSGERDVVDAYQRLMRHFHPELRGSDYLAIKIEQAKNRLLDA